LGAELAQAQEELVRKTGNLQSELDQLRGDNERLQAQLASGDQETGAAIEQAQARVGELERRLEQDAAGSEEAVGQLRAEILELGQRLEERDMALNTAREEHQEFIEALNTANAERETLQLAVSDRDDEQARLVDLENQVAEALRTHQNELIAHEQEQRRLREQLAEESDRRRSLQEELDRLSAVSGQPTDADECLADEHADLLEKLTQRDREVEQLRSVISEYVDQIRAAQPGGGQASDVEALRAELEMVREQAIRDVAQMREQLAAADVQKRRLQQADGREAISHEAMRQQIEALETSLGERQRELGNAQGAQHMLEDSLEDANRQLDKARSDLEKAQAEMEEALSSRREADSARKQLQETLGRLQEDAETAKVTDLRDDRLTPSKGAIGLDTPGRLMPALLGAGVLFGGLEAVSFLTGNGELITALLGLSGR
jgi:chromosome segregation ATPase